MKELSIEEKSKRYDEAKYIMKEYLESGNAGVIAENTIKKAFPELKENEDERIKKIIKNTLQSYNRGVVVGSLNAVDYADCIAWLEKQGEQKPAWSEEDIYKIEDALFRTYAVDVAARLLNKIKSIRPQNRWKPSEEQKLAVETAINVIGKNTLSGKHLIDLLGQIKAL